MFGESARIASTEDAGEAGTEVSVLDLGVVQLGTSSNDRTNDHVKLPRVQYTNL